MNPLVSIIVPTHNNEATIVRTLNSLVEQTLHEIEIVVVDDASLDSTVALCRDAQRLDSRIFVHTLEDNQTALHTRRIGAEQATGTYIMFCDGDDELFPQAAEEASAFAMGGGYEVVHFGTTIISTTGSEHVAWERALDPFAEELFGQDILLSSPFGQPGSKINGSIWNKLYEKSLVQNAWSSINPSLRLPRAQDVYQTLLVLAKATRYGGLSTPLYRYNFGAGRSGNLKDRESFNHFLASSETYRSIRDYVEYESFNLPENFDHEEMLGRLRDQFIDNQLEYWFQLPRPLDETLADLLRQWGPDPVLRRLARRHTSKVRRIVEAFSRLDTKQLVRTQVNRTAGMSHHVALLGNISGNGGVQRVMAVQAESLLRAGYSVSILSFEHDPGEIMDGFPSGAIHRSLGPRGDVGAGVSELIQILREGNISALLNHDNYSALFPWVAAVTRTLGIPSALFLHSFSLRALHDFSEIFAYLPEIARSYDNTVTLSDADRKWWEASGVTDVLALPNFGPSVVNDATSECRDAEDSSQLSLEHRSVDLLWVGRLQDGTKNVSGALEAFARVVSLRPGTTLAIVGGEQRSGDLSRLEQIAERLGVRHDVSFIGQVQNVAPWYRSAKVLLSTGSIEGFNLTLVEAQSFRLPVAMFDLPYLEPVIGNPGVLSVEWGATDRLAEVAVELLNDPERARELGASGREFARQFSLEGYEHRLHSIVERLCSLPPNTEAPDSNESTAKTATAIVPVSVMRELYRLYEGMQHRYTTDLQAAKRENAGLRKNLSQLKRSLNETKNIHKQLERSISQVEKRASPGPQRHSTPPNVLQSQDASSPTAEGVWPLWGRQGTQPILAPSSVAFDDLDTTDPVALPAAWALDSGVLGSPTSRQFNGDDAVTRYDLIAMLHRLAGAPITASELAIYRDLDPNDPATSWAAQRGILKRSSKEDTSKVPPKWNPAGPLLRRSAAMILFRAAGTPQYRPPHVSPYADLLVDQKFYREMCWAAHQGVLPATRDEQGRLVFDEKRTMTRSELVSALFNQMVGPLVVSKNE